MVLARWRHHLFHRIRVLRGHLTQSAADIQVAQGRNPPIGEELIERHSRVPGSISCGLSRSRNAAIIQSPVKNSSSNLAESKLARTLSGVASAAAARTFRSGRAYLSQWPAARADDVMRADADERRSSSSPERSSLASMHDCAHCCVALLGHAPRRARAGSRGERARSPAPRQGALCRWCPVHPDGMPRLRSVGHPRW